MAATRKRIAQRAVQPASGPAWVQSSETTAFRSASGPKCGEGVGRRRLQRVVDEAQSAGERGKRVLVDRRASADRVKSTGTG